MNAPSHQTSARSSVLMHATVILKRASPKSFRQAEGSFRHLSIPFAWPYVRPDIVHAKGIENLLENLSSS